MSSGTRAPGVEVAGLQVSYSGAVAVRDASFEISAGTATAVIGPNGAGKSTLLKAMLGLVPWDSGLVRMLGLPVERARTRVAYVPQRGEVDWSFPITVADTVLLGTYPRLGLFRRPGRAERALAADALDQVGLTGVADRQIGQLSGGQQQRVFIARALAQQPEVVLLDEPFVGVDSVSEQVIVEILEDLRQTGATIVAVHHNLSTAADYFGHALLLNRAPVAHGPAAEVLTDELLNRTYRPGPELAATG
ncbi:metal ABC transporter ATP-binding protein [Tomitella biformata]|uniref:metal ABC transporter ATP-binding protein n=1 Tax=Tomitella biformata TaxID=630403 RepID=UPI00046549EB|nr:ABC transporter ATP-binding protein [Tomitella biformata]